MRQTQILRVHKRRVLVDLALVAVPVAAISDTAAAAAIIDALEDLLAEMDALNS